MKFDSNLHHRSTQRLRGYDYSSEGYYFVTICLQDRRCLLGDIVDNKMLLNSAGEMVRKWWIRITENYRISIDKFVVMPNHFHGILRIPEVDLVFVGADQCVRPTTTADAHRDIDIPHAIQWFKTMTTNDYIKGVKTSGWKPFDGRLWQRNFYDHIIEERDDYDGLLYYIEQNPANWREDPIYSRN